MENNGYANNVQRGFVAMGLFKDQQDVEMSPTQFGTVRPGDIKYRDINGDGKITDDDKVPLFAYSGVPQLMYGIGAAIGQLLRPKTNRLLYFYWLSGPWHICVLLFVISYHKGTNKKRNQETNKKQKCT